MVELLIIIFLTFQICAHLQQGDEEEGNREVCGQSTLIVSDQETLVIVW